MVNSRLTISPALTGSSVNDLVKVGTANTVKSSVAGVLLTVAPSTVADNELVVLV